jgi:hypothetical protein
MAAGVSSGSLIDDFLAGARLLGGLPAFLRNPVTLPEASRVLARRLAQRDADFLSLVRPLYTRPDHPYHRLLGHAGCQYGDVERLVAREGLEPALHALYQQGVYLTSDELKGRKPVVRGAMTFQVDPAQLRSGGAGHFRIQSSGSRGTPTTVLTDLVSVRDHAIDMILCLEASGQSGSAHAVWGVPGSAAMSQVLRLASCGYPPARWFSQVDPADPGLHPRYRLGARVMRWGSLLAGVPLPRPQYVPVEASLPIARWIADVAAAGRNVQIWTFASSAVRLCQAAKAAGIHLHGAQFTTGGEPTTEARMTTVREAGAVLVPRYGANEAGPIGFGCLAPADADEVHVLGDLHAVIQPGEAGARPDLPPRALLLSSLRPTARLMLLNVSSGDQGVLRARRCGCPLEDLGWTTHLREIRSFEKLTAAGMTFADVHLVRVLEEILPARFGGGPADYQLVEEEAEGGRPRLSLLVHPGVGPLDPVAVRETFLATVSQGSGVERVMGLAWREAALLRIERRAPERTSAGKILHLRSPRATLQP